MADGECEYGQGYLEHYDRNHCFMTQVAGTIQPSSAACDPRCADGMTNQWLRSESDVSLLVRRHPVDTPGHPVPTPARAGNTYWVTNVSRYRYVCGGVSWNLTQEQAMGLDLGSRVLPLGDTQTFAENVVRLSKRILGMEVDE